MLSVQLNATLLDIGLIKTNQMFVAGNPEQNAALLQQVRRSLERGAVTRAFNAAVTWRHRGFNAMVSMNYTGNTLTGISRSDVRFTGQALGYTNLTTYLKPRTTVDLRLEYSYSRRVVPFVQLRNLFNERFTSAQNGAVLNVQNYIDPKLEFGVRGTW